MKNIEEDFIIMFIVTLYIKGYTYLNISDDTLKELYKISNAMKILDKYKINDMFNYEDSYSNIKSVINKISIEEDLFKFDYDNKIIIMNIDSNKVKKILSKRHFIAFADIELLVDYIINFLDQKKILILSHKQ